ncbi:unnamed protein product [Rotaria sp. Silwood1]|nr:unnamed protein product [Rotaria sp. Silwood1]
MNILWLHDNINDHKELDKQLKNFEKPIINFTDDRSCIAFLKTSEQENNDRPSVLIVLNRIGRQIVPEIHSYTTLLSIVIFCTKNDNKIKWANKYNKIRGIFIDPKELKTYVRQVIQISGLLLWHLVCLDDHSDEVLRHHLYELDPCIRTFDRFDICQTYLDSINQRTIATKPVLFVAINRMGRQFIPEIHSNDRLKAFYIFISSDSTNDRKTKWTTKYNKIKRVCADINQLIAYIKQDAAVLTHSIIRNYLTDLTDEKISFIVSDAFGQHIVPLIHEIPQIKSIYVFCGVNKSNYEAWAKEYEKIKGVFTQIESICDRLKQDVRQSNHNLIAVSFVPSFDSFINVNSDQLDPSFMYTQLLKNILLDMKYDETAKREFVNYCRKQFVGNVHQLREIYRFEREYNDHSPIWWYTHGFGLYSMVNKALRTLDIELIVKIGFFICDLHRHIEQLHVNQFSSHSVQPFIVYRGQGLSKTDFAKLNKAKGGLMSFNNFLSTSRDRDISLAFAESNQSNLGLVGILFVMTIDPLISSTPFASIQDVSYFQDSENEVLFSMHTVFRIGGIRGIDRENRLWQVDLILTSDNDRQLQVLTEHIRQNIESGTGFQRLGALMLEMGQYDRALEVYETLLNATHLNEDQQRISSLYNQLGAIYSRKRDLGEALAHYKKSLEIKLTYLSPNDPSLSSIYSNIGSVLRNQNQLNEALEYMERALHIELLAPQPNSLKIASYHNNIGLVLTDLNNFNSALIYYEQAFKIQQKYLPPNHPDLATSYNNIGAIYNELQDYSKALSFYEKSLDIMQRSLPLNHPDLAVPYNNLASIYNELQEYSKALLYYEKSIQIMQKSLPPNHPFLALAYHNLALTFYRLRSYKTALEYGERAIEIYYRALEPNDPQVITCQETLNAIREKL